MYLTRKRTAEVYAACANTGGFSEEQLKTNEENAHVGRGEIRHSGRNAGVLRKEFEIHGLRKCVAQRHLSVSVSSNVFFRHWLSHRYANEIGADAITHGSTGAGNDQIRFDMTFLVLAPNVEIITLTRDSGLEPSGRNRLSEQAWLSMPTLPN